jgi:hypothetical protein
VTGFVTLLVGCGHSIATRTQSGTNPGGTVQCQGWSARGTHISIRGHVRADVGKDGIADVVEVAARYGAPPPCRFALLVRSGQRLVAERLRQGISPATRSDAEQTPWPRLISVIRLPSPAPIAAVVLVDQGAGTGIVRLFALRSARIAELQPSALSRFTFGSDGRVAEGAGCVVGAKSELLLSSTAVASPTGWRVTRRFYTVTEQLRLRRVQMEEFVTQTLPGLPEFRLLGNAPRPFSGCVIGWASDT